MKHSHALMNKCNANPKNAQGSPHFFFFFAIFSLGTKVMKKHILALLLCSLLLASTFMEPASATSMMCARKCKARCAKAKAKYRCVKYCNICCSKCKCVPSGTYGNKHQCPCYRDIRNSKGKPKCP